jgi:hypothetical protein
MDPNANGQFDDIRLQMDANPTNGLIGGAVGACNEGNEDVTITYNVPSLSILLRDNILNVTDTRTDRTIAGLEFVYRSPQRAVITNVAQAAQIAFVETRITVRSKLDDRNLAAPVTYVVSSEVRVRSR